MMVNQRLLRSLQFNTQASLTVEVVLILTIRSQVSGHLAERPGAGARLQGIMTRMPGPLLRVPGSTGMRRLNPSHWHGRRRSGVGPAGVAATLFKILNSGSKFRFHVNNFNLNLNDSVLV
jgi:hypothetical protein